MTCAAPNTPRREHWARYDQLVESAEGWALFNVDSSPEIQKDDETDRFESDADAVAFVIEEARKEAGTIRDTHTRALLLHYGLAEWDWNASPELTGEYACPKCGNQTEFIGQDSDGYGGPDECECGEEVCTCETVLRQPFSVPLRSWQIAPEDRAISYESFEGGGSDAEIGDYDRIECARCGAVIWETDPAEAIAPERTPRPPAADTLRSHYLLVVWGDTEPEVRGPYPTDEARVAVAVELRADDPEKRNGLYRLDAGAGAPKAEPFYGWELDPREEDLDPV